MESLPEVNDSLLSSLEAELQASRFGSAERLVLSIEDRPLRTLAEAALHAAKASDPRKGADYSASARRKLAEYFLGRQVAGEAARSLLFRLLEAAHFNKLPPTGADEPPGRDHRNDPDAVVRRFYFEGAADGHSAGRVALSAKATLDDALRRPGTLSDSDFFIEFDKWLSSYTPLVSSAVRSKLGGGYFAGFGGYGCVIDPGHHFLDNFFNGRRSIHDVNGIVITHFHDDHYADLPALLSLLHQRAKQQRRDGMVASPVDLFFDVRTFEMFGALINSTIFSGQRRKLVSASRETIRLTKVATLQPIRTFHEVLKENSGVGLVFDVELETVRPVRLVVTGDTGWRDEMEALYRSLRHPRCILVAHVSTVAPEEAMGVLFDDDPGFYANHLGVRGVCRAIAALQPARVVLSEIGEELQETVGELAEMIEDFFPCSCSVGWPGRPVPLRIGSANWGTGQQV